MTRKYVATGFVDLDRSLGGIEMGELVVLASRSGMGESILLSNIFANNVIESIAKNFPIRCAYFSFEHNIKKVWRNTVSRISKFNFETGTLNKDELYSEQKMNSANEMLETLQQEGKICFYEDNGLDATLFYIALNAAEQKYKYGLDLVFVDGFQKLTLYDGSGKNIIASRLKQLAEKLDVSIIITAPIERPQRYEDCLENINLQLVRVADKIIFLRRLDVTATRIELLRGDIKEGDSILTVMKNVCGLYGYANVCFDYGNDGFFNYPKRNND